MFRVFVTIVSVFVAFVFQPSWPSCKEVAATDVPTVIDRAARILATLHVPFTSAGDELVVPAAGAEGFEVRLRMVDDRSFVVMFEQWRHDFDRAEDAYDCFEYGLSDSCRLKVVSRGDAPEQWQVEKREFGMWVPGHAETRRSWAFWKPRRIEYRQNHVFTRPG